MNQPPLCPVRSVLQQVLRSRPKAVVLPKSRTIKKNLHRSSAFFIAESWMLMTSGDASLDLSKIKDDVPKDFHSVDSYIRHLNSRKPCFGWAWIRARMEERVESSLDQILPELEKKFPAEWKEYQSLLRKNGYYWFRQSIRHHLRLGYHTAVSVIMKFLGTVQYESNESVRPLKDQYIASIFDACKTFAAFDLELLVSSDGILWDSAAATSFSEWAIDNDELLIAAQTPERILSKLAERPERNESILGCPALKSSVTDSDQGTVFASLFGLIVKAMQSFTESSE